MSLLIKLAWRNLWRNKRRSLLNIVAIGVATILLIFQLSLQKGAYTTMIENSVRVHSGHVQIQTRRYFEDPKFTRVIKNPDEITSFLEKLPHVKNWVKRLQVPALLSSETTSAGAIIIGTEVKRELNFSTIPRVIKMGRFLSPGNSREVILGKILAENLGVKPGDEVVFISQAADGSLTYDMLKVVGIFRSGVPELDRTTAYTSLKTLQEMFYMENGVNYIAVLLDTFLHAGEVKETLNKYFSEKKLSDIRAYTWDEIMPGLKQAIILDASTGYIFFIILLFIVASGVFNTFLMSVLERMREIGVMKAMGVKPLQMAFIIFFEALFLALTGTATGVTVGVPVVLYFKKTGISFGEEASKIMQQWGFPPRIHPDINVWIPVIVGCVIFIMVLVAAFYPMVKSARIKEIDALRFT